MTHTAQEAASANVLRIDWLFLLLTALCGLIAVGLAILIVTFCVRYRHGSPADRHRVPVRARLVEVVWTVVPLWLFIGLCGWGAYDYLQQNRWPADAMPVFVVGKQSMWTLEHRNGRARDQRTARAARPAGAAVDDLAGRHPQLLRAGFSPETGCGAGPLHGAGLHGAGSYELFCAEYCGAEHARMGGRIVALPEAQFAHWLAQGQGARPGLAERGRQLFARHGCDGCHGAGAAVRAPPLAGLPGSTVTLQDGRRVQADDNYLRDAMLLPGRDVVAGNAPVMPSYAGQLSEEDLLAIIECLRGMQDGR